MDYKEAAKLMETCKFPERGKPIQNNTRLRGWSSDGLYRIVLHNTAIITIHKGNRWTLNTGGWYTATTKDRINRYLPENVRVWSEKGIWKIYYYDPANPVIMTRRRRNFHYEDQPYQGGDGKTYVYSKKVFDPGMHTEEYKVSWHERGDFFDGVIIDAKGNIKNEKADPRFHSNTRVPNEGRMVTIPKDKPILAWHFIEKNRLLRYSDNRFVNPGVTYSYEGQPQLCSAGMHASVSLMDAARYAPGFTLCRVQLWGKAVRGDDKLTAQHRHVLWMTELNDEALARLAHVRTGTSPESKTGYTEKNVIQYIEKLPRLEFQAEQSLSAE